MQEGTDRYIGINLVQIQDADIESSVSISGNISRGVWKNKQVAVKDLYKNGHSLTADEHEQLLRDVAIAASLRHPNLIIVYGVTETGRIVMELGDSNLWDCYRRNKQRPHDKISWRLKLQMLYDGAKGLEYVHSCGKTHENVKTRNFIICGIDYETSVVKLSDIDLAASRSSSRVGSFGSSSASSQNTISCSVYWAPELYGSKPHSTETDVYSFGVVAGEVASQKTPFGTGCVFNSWTVMESKMKGVIPCELPEDCPQELANIIHECCHESPEARPLMSDVCECLWHLVEQHAEGGDGAREGASRPPSVESQ